MRILTTGAHGHVGQYVIERLKPIHEIYAIVRTPDPDVAKDFAWLNLDLSQPDFCDRLPVVDAIIHLAQSPHYRSFPDQGTNVFSVNVQSTLTLLDWARKTHVKHFIFASSGSVYAPNTINLTEDSPTRTADIYALSKKTAEKLCLLYAPFMNITVLRPFFIYGPGQRPTMFMPRLIASVKSGTPINCEGPEGLWCNPIYVQDVVSAIEQALNLRGLHTINLAGPDVISLRQLGILIGEHLGKEPHVNVNPAAPAKRIVADITKQTSLLGAPTTGLKLGIMATIATT